MVNEKRKRKKTFGIDVFVMVSADNEDEAVDIVERDNLVLEITRIREVDILSGN